MKIFMKQSQLRDVNINQEYFKYILFSLFCFEPPLQNTSICLQQQQPLPDDCAKHETHCRRIFILF